MPEIKLDIDFSTHPKVVGLHPLSQLLFIRSLAYCSKYLTDGVLPAHAIPLLTYDYDKAVPVTEPGKPNMNLVEFCVSQLSRPGGQWETQNNVWVIHDYLNYQWSKEQVQAYRHKRAEKNRENGRLGGRPKKPKTTQPKPTLVGCLSDNTNNPTLTPLIPKTESYPDPDPDLSDSFPEQGSSLESAPASHDTNPPDPEKKDSEQKPFLKKAKTKRTVKQSAESLSGETWEAYSAAYIQRYHVAPVRHAGVNSMLGTLVKKLGATESPVVAAFYVTHNNPFYVAKRHPVNLLVFDAEGLRTQWATGVKATSGEAKNAEARDNDREQIKRVEAILKGGGV